MPVPGSSDRFETHVDRLIRESIERGEFDDLPGSGEPIAGVGSKDDALWWVRRWVKRNLKSDGADQEGAEPSNLS